MSLVNRMLQDLESDRDGALEDAVLRGLEPPPPAPLRRRSGWLMLALGLLALAGGGLAAKVWLPVRVPPIAVALPALMAPPVEPILPASPQPVIEPVLPAVPPPPAPVTVPAARLQALRLTEADGRLRLVLETDRAVEYQLDTSTPGLYRWWLAATEAEPLLPLPALPGSVAELTLAPTAGGVTITARLRQTLPYEEFLLPPQGDFGARLVTDFALPPQVVTVTLPPPAQAVPAMPPATAPVASLPMTMAPVAVDSGRLYQQALQHTQRGQTSAAVDGLRHLVQLAPEHLEGRELLAALLARQGQPAAAESLLREGLSLHPEHVPFRVGYGRLLLERGALEELAPLLASPPPLALFPDFHALAAAVAHARGDYVGAVSTYRQLLQQRDQAEWWLGLAVAAEGAGDQDQARAAYRRVLENGTAPAALQQFSRQRLGMLTE